MREQALKTLEAATGKSVKHLAPVFSIEITGDTFKTATMKLGGKRKYSFDFYDEVSDERMAEAVHELIASA